MFRVIIVSAAVALAATAAFAASKWNGPGWYQLWDDGLTEGIEAGPFADERACKAALPAKNEDLVYYCDHLSAPPPED